MIFIPLHIAAMVILMRLFARNEADLDLPKCALFFGVTIALLHVAAAAIGPWALVLYFLLPLAVLGLFFCVPWPKAAAIAACFAAYSFTFTLILHKFST